MCGLYLLVLCVSIGRGYSRVFGFFVDGEIGASPVMARAGNALVEAMFANEVRALRAGAVKEVKLMDVRAYVSLSNRCLELLLSVCTRPYPLYEALS